MTMVKIETTINPDTTIRKMNNASTLFAMVEARGGQSGIF
jgi:hypothetical protein